MDHASNRQHRVLGALGLLGVTFWGALAVYAVHASLPENPIGPLPFEVTVAPQTWLPQTYGFFSRSPQYKRLIPYLRDANGAWRVATHGPESAPENLFGLDRITSARSGEVELLTQSIPASSFTPCNGDVLTCLATATPVEHVETFLSHDAALCGEVAIVRWKPVPWAWRKHVEHMTSEIAVVEVRC